MPHSLDQIMESASLALARMDYLACETLCLEALALARSAHNWAYYARILLPLQESRRHRRMIASEGVMRLGTTDLAGDPVSWLTQLPSGCIVLTHPHTAEHARILAHAARSQHRFVEVLLGDNPTLAPQWILRSFVGPKVHCWVPRPAAQWVDRWITPEALEAPEAPKTAEATEKSDRSKRQGQTPADWFIDATEALGDAALANANVQEVGERQIEALERCLEAVTDHEIIHQRLGEATRAMQLR